MDPVMVLEGLAIVGTSLQAERLWLARLEELIHLAGGGPSTVGRKPSSHAVCHGHQSAVSNG
jgi:hypothetical protein